MHDEHVIGLDCFGARCRVAVTDSNAASSRALTAVRFLLDCHRRLSRFLPDSELSRLNADERETVPVSPLMLDFRRAAGRAAERSGGLVDPTILPALRAAGYAGSLSGRDPGDLATGIAGRPVTRPGAPDPAERWRAIAFDAVAGTVTRPPGLEIASGGVAKGWAADAAAAMLRGAPTLAVDCAGDIRVGGSAGVGRAIAVADPFGGEPVAALTVHSGGVATSGIGRRRWRNRDGSTGHHLIDPASGRPCFSGVVQATALAPSAEEAELRAKAALLAGPDAASEWLPDGGLLVLDGGAVVEVGDRSETGIAAAAS
jgi:thiamine biosynthesis lipoprotein